MRTTSADSGAVKMVSSLNLKWGWWLKLIMQLHISAKKSSTMSATVIEFQKCWFRMDEPMSPPGSGKDEKQPSDSSCKDGVQSQMEMAG
jgi:hypothetical protein